MELIPTPATLKTDNQTIQLNELGEIQIKEGGITENLLDSILKLRVGYAEEGANPVFSLSSNNSFVNVLDVDINTTNYNQLKKTQWNIDALYWFNSITTLVQILINDNVIISFSNTDTGNNPLNHIGEYFNNLDVSSISLLNLKVRARTSGTNLARATEWRTGSTITLNFL